MQMNRTSSKIKAAKATSSKHVYVSLESWWLSWLRSPEYEPLISTTYLLSKSLLDATTPRANIE